MKEEIITETSITISIKGNNEKDINARMSKAFDLVQKQLIARKTYGSKLIGKNRVSWEVSEEAKHV